MKSQNLINDMALFFFSQKIILAKTQYKTNKHEFQAIIEVFKTCFHYLKTCKFEIFTLINFNNFCQLINTKNTSLK